MRALVMLVAILGLGLTAAPAAADTEESCSSSTGFEGASVQCKYSPDEMRAMYATAKSSGVVYRIQPACTVGGTATCSEPARCSDPPNTFLFDVFRSPDTVPRSWQVIGQTCLTEQDAGELGALTPGMVLRAFRALDWPAPELSVQPPDGETLVNFDTNFFTTLTDPEVRTVTLVGIQVEIEATPGDYHWHFGDGTDETTSSPGSAYPDLEVTHSYARKGEVSASVDVTYTGRYRIGGSGAWADIPGTLTVPGPAVGLSVLEAKPKLVGG